MISRRDVLTSLAAISAFDSPISAANQTGRSDASHPEPGPDLILHNGKMLTLDSQSSVADAIAIRGRNISAVGRKTELFRHRTAQTKVIDLKGRTVIPGLVDAHAHMDREGLKTLNPSLGSVRSISDVQDGIADLVRKAKPGTWIVTMPIGTPPFYFDNSPENLAEKRWPTRTDLDKPAPNNPVYIRCIWGFWRSTPPLVSCANSKALELASITRDTKSPDSSLTIDRDASGDPTGIFIESEMQPLAELIWFRDVTQFSPADRRRTLPIAAAAYHSFGITSIFEGHGVAGELMQAYQDVHRQGKLTMRSTLAFSPNWSEAADPRIRRFVDAWVPWLAEPGLGDDLLRVRGMYAQTVDRPSNRIRAGVAPYTGWAGHNYACALTPERLKELGIACARNDIRLIINAGMTPEALDVLEQIDREFPLKGRRWVLGHMGGLRPSNIDRVARLGLVIGIHINSALYKFGDEDARALGPERSKSIVPMRRLLSAGIPVAFESDNVPISPFWPVWLAVSRRSRSNQQIAPDQAINRIEALRCASLGGAYLTFDENRLGSLERGKMADLAILDADPMSVSENQIREIKSVATMVNGRFVYLRDSSVVNGPNSRASDG